MSTASLTDIAVMLDAEILGSGRFWMHIRAETDGLSWVIEQQGADAFVFRAYRGRQSCGATFTERSPERVAATISSPTWHGSTVEQSCHDRSTASSGIKCRERMCSSDA